MKNYEKLDETDPVKEEDCTRPRFRNSTGKVWCSRVTYDCARGAVGARYAEKGNAVKSLEYANMMETEVWRGE